jgi:hypothetical protein
MTSPFPISYPPLPENEVMVQYFNESLVSQGMIEWATVTATLNYNAVGSWNVVMPFTQAMWNMMMSGDFVIQVNWRGLFTFGGKCEQPAFSNSIPGSTSAAASGGRAGPFITLSGADFMAPLANRICYPDPTQPWASQVAKSADAVAGVPLETAIKHYVNRNISSKPITLKGDPNVTPAAIPSRQHPLFDIAPDQGRGPAVNYIVRFQSGVNLNLLDVIRALISQAYPNAAPGEGMGFSCVQNGSRILFDCFLPVNKTNVSFSEDLGNLTSINFSLTDPTCTNALVQASTPLMTNANPPVALVNPPHNPFYEAVSPGTTTWNRVETFVDDSTETDETNMKTTASNTLTSGAMGPTLTTTVTDTPYTIYGRDYAIGDIVTVEIQPGNIYTDIVTSVTLTADPTGTPILNVVPVIGNSTASENSSPAINKQLIARIRTLEKRLNAKGL